MSFYPRRRGSYLVAYVVRRVLGALAVAFAFWLLHSVDARAATATYSGSGLTFSMAGGCNSLGGNCWSGTTGASRAGLCSGFAAAINTSNASVAGFSPHHMVSIVAGTGDCETANDNGTHFTYPITPMCSAGGSYSGSYPTESCSGGPPPSSCSDKAGGYATGWSSESFWKLGPGAKAGTAMFGALNYCAEGCVASWEGTGVAYSRIEDGVEIGYAKGGFVWENESCSASGTAPTALASLPTNSCKPGQDGGTVNGKFICVDRLSGNPADTNDTDGDGIPDSEDSDDDNDGTPDSSDDSPKGSCVGLACSDPDWSKDGSGGGGGGGGGGDGGGPPDPADPEDPTNDMKNFCKDNPDTLLCKKSTITATCAAAGGNVECSGDAVMCQIAKEQAIRNCELFQKTSPQSDLGNQVMAGNDPTKSSFPKPNEPTTMSVGTIGGSEIFGATCIADKAVSMLGQSMTIPLSRVCPYASALGFAWVAFCSLAAMMIVGRGAG